MNETQKPYKSPLTAPAYGSEEYETLGAALETARQEQQQLLAAIRKAEIDTNRSKHTTPKGSEARSRLTYLRVAQDHKQREIKLIRDRLALSDLERRYAEAADEACQLGLELRIHTTRYPVESPDWWQAWPDTVLTERNRLYAALETRAGEAKAFCPDDFTPEMCNAVAQDVQSKLFYGRLETPYSDLVAQAIRDQQRTRDSRLERERIAKEEAQARYQSLQPLSALRGIRTKQTWRGNALYCWEWKEGEAHWASDGTMGFVIPTAPNKTVQKLTASYTGWSRPDYKKLKQFLAEATVISQPAECLGWTVACQVAYTYFQTTESLIGVDADKLNLLSWITKPDAYGYATVIWEQDDRPIRNSVLLLYCAQALVGFLVPVMNAPAIQPVETSVSCYAPSTANALPRRQHGHR